jgi:subtilase family serine protease
MIQRLFLSFLALVALVVLSSNVCDAQSLPLYTRHVREVTLNGQAPSVGRLPATQFLHIVLILPLRNQEALDSFLKDLYDPASPTYRRFLTVEEFTARFGPTQEDYDAVIHFAQTRGLTVVGTSRNRLNLDVTGTAAQIELALHVNLGLYRHPTENRMFYAPDREPTPDLPVRLWHIAGLDNYSIPKPALVHRDANGQANRAARPSATTGSGPGASFLGSDMRAAYYGGTALTGSGQSLGLVEFYGTDLSDLNTYYANVGQTNTVPITLVSTDGSSLSCIYPLCDDTEQTIDMTQALGMAPGLSSLVVYVGSTDAPIFNAMATASQLNAQLSCSWAWSPADPATDNPYFQEFAAQGQNLFQAAGDSGVWKSTSEVFPVDDVYLTSVGGTDLETASAAGPWSSETAWADGGGGISPNGFAIPSWQTATAAGCVNCSQTLRNAPDVSANANFTYYVCADQSACTENYYGGTSFAAPLWAGYLALANQQALLNGQPTLGFINPSLYSIGLSSNYDADFHDITSGSNGDSASVGYDLATGWGTPNGVALINALAGPAVPGFTLSASPASVSVVQGNSGTSTITSAVTGGFNSAVSLTASGEPAGVTVSFGTNPIAAPGSGTSVMTITVTSSAATGTYPITVTGTSGSITETATVSLTVTAPLPPGFTLSASPASVSVVQGNSGTSTITSAVMGGFNSAISLTASGQPSGVTVAFNPGSITGAGTSTMMLTVASSTATGTYAITVTGTSGSITATTTVSMTVTAPAAGNFSVSASPGLNAVFSGQSATFTVKTKISGGFNSPIDLSASGQGPGNTVTFSPNPIAAPGSGTSTMTVQTSPNSKTGFYTITITATGRGVTHTTKVTLGTLQ